MNALFVGMYPNNVNEYRNVFFQNLIFAMADAGVKCTVVSPVPITKYWGKTRRIPKKTVHTTPLGSTVEVYYPRVISASSKQIGPYNTEHLSEALFERAALNAVRKLDQKFDFVYGHFFLYGGLAAVRIGRFLNIPSFIAYGECDFDSQVKNSYGIPTPRELKGLSGIISVSTKNTNELNGLGFVKDVPIITAPNSTDLSLFTKIDKKVCRTQLGIPEEKFVVGFVGGFIERKGDKRLLEAVNGLENVYLAFAGKGDNPPCGDKVLFCRALSHDDVPVFLNAIDVFCLPTLSEGSCNAIVEAMACGLPIVSSDLEFNDDALTPDNSIRIDPRSVTEIRNAIKKIYDDPKLSKKLANAAFETSKQFSIEQRAKKIIDFIGNFL